MKTFDELIAMYDNDDGMFFEDVLRVATGERDAKIEQLRDRLAAVASALRDKLAASESATAHSLTFGSVRAADTWRELLAIAEGGGT